MYEASKLIEAVRELANEYPDAYYDSGDEEESQCFYTFGDVKVGNKVVGCGCIMGQAILKAYPDTKEMLEKEDKFKTVCAIGGIVAIWGFERTVQQEYWLNYVQTKQDEGKTWGMAVKMADTMRPLP